jgi:hypothetical protein
LGNHLIRQKQNKTKKKCWFSSLNVPMGEILALYNKFSSCYVCHSFQLKITVNNHKDKKKW